MGNVFLCHSGGSGKLVCDRGVVKSPQMRHPSTWNRSCLRKTGLRFRNGAARHWHHCFRLGLPRQSTRCRVAHSDVIQNWRQRRHVRSGIPNPSLPRSRCARFPSRCSGGLAQVQHAALHRLPDCSPNRFSRLPDPDARLPPSRKKVLFRFQISHRKLFKSDGHAASVYKQNVADVARKASTERQMLLPFALTQSLGKSGASEAERPV